MQPHKQQLAIFTGYGLPILRPDQQAALAILWPFWCSHPQQLNMKDYGKTEPCLMPKELKRQQPAQAAQLQAQGFLCQQKDRPRLQHGTWPPNSPNNPNPYTTPRQPRQYAIWLHLKHRPANSWPGGYRPDGPGRG